MHELSIGEAILRTVQSRSEGCAVRRVDVRIGHLRQVVPGALTLAWEVLTMDTHLAGCELVIEHVPAVVHCRRCERETTLDWPVLQCGWCDGLDVELVSGEELQLSSLDVAQEVG